MPTRKSGGSSSKPAGSSRVASTRKLSTALPKHSSLDPKNGRAYCGRGIAFLREGSPDTAIADFTDAIVFSPTDPAALSGRAEAYVLMGKLARAIDDATAAIRLDQRCAPAYCHRAVGYLRQGNLARGDADMARAVALDPSLKPKLAAEREEAVKRRSVLAEKRPL